MEAFFIRVMIGAAKSLIKDPEIQKWIEDRFNGVLQQFWSLAEAKIESEFDALPDKLLGVAGTTVTDLLHEIPGTTGDIASAVKGQVAPIIPSTSDLENIFQNAIKQLPGGGILGGIFGK